MDGCVPGGSGWRRRLWRLGPWFVLILAVVPAVWRVVEFPVDVDPEYPHVVRPTFSPLPPPAYRLAEPGDTIDRIAICAAAVGVVLAASGAWRTRRCRGLWPAALALALGLFWHASTPGPLLDGWYGIGWRTVADSRAPAPLRIGLGLAALGLTGLTIASAWVSRGRWRPLWQHWRANGAATLLLAAAFLLWLSQVEISGLEPAGYWPRWAQVWGILAFDLGLIRLLPRPAGEGKRRCVTGRSLAGVAAVGVLIAAGLGINWYQRPIGRLREMVPGRIYISAMPTPCGLELAQRRHRFKTIVNLFPEDTELRSPYHEDEVRFAAEHGIRYVGNGGDELASDGFLDETLALAQDPAAWPILVHCHGCADRTPAWMGLYRFVVEGRSLADVMREVEQRRGNRPKGSVTLLYNHALPPRAPGRYRNDPTAELLRRCAASTPDPYAAAKRAKAAAAESGANPDGRPRVSQRDGARAR